MHESLGGMSVPNLLNYYEAEKNDTTGLHVSGCLGPIFGNIRGTSDICTYLAHAIMDP